MSSKVPSYDDFYKEVKAYLDDKIPYVSESTRLEIASFITCRTAIFCSDIINSIKWEKEKQNDI